ncbi:MAG: glycosyltransferase [Acidobacteria bacterium]|nr:glycosyltransferase [Acidobacteriota bacterium]
MSSSPLFSIVIPNLNGARFLAEALESVLAQSGPTLELIVVDGGSTDGSLEILDRFRDHIDVLIAEPDRGQADAIMKGAATASGQLFNWINSDDLLLPGALETVANAIGNHNCFGGAVQEVDESGQPVGVVLQRRLTAEAILRHPWRGSSYHQPGVWLRRDKFLDCGGLDVALHFAFDRDMMIRYLASGESARITDQPLAGFRLHSGSKTVSQSDRFNQEQRETLVRYSEHGPPRLRKIAAAHLERLMWWSDLEEIEAMAEAGHRIEAATRIVRGVVTRPRTRAGRASLRALARVVFARH